MDSKEVKGVNQNGYGSGKESSNIEEVDNYNNLYYDLRSPVSYSRFYKLYNKIKMMDYLR